MQQGVSLSQCSLMLYESCFPNTLPYSQCLLEIKEPILFTIISKIHSVKKKKFAQFNDEQKNHRFLLNFGNQR